MDYAKLALLKAEQLERQGQPVSTAVRRAGLVFEQSVLPNVNFEICTLAGGGEGESAVIVSLQFENSDESGGSGGGGSSGGSGGDGGSGGRVEFRLGARTVFTRPYAESMVFMASVLLSGKQTVNIRTNRAMRLLSADVLVIGGDIINAAAESVRFARQGDFSAVVSVSGGNVLLSAGSGVPDMSKPTLAGFGECATVAGLQLSGDTHFAVCFADADKNVFLTLTTADGQMLSCKKLPFKADNVALIGQESHLCLGYVYKGIAYAALVAPPDFSPNMTTRLEDATSIEFVRQCKPPAVILGKSKGSVIRMAQDEISADDVIAIKFEC